MEKAKNAGISLYPEEIKTLRDRSKLKDHGSPTRYFRRLFEADIANQPVPTAYDDRILEKLATTYAGYFAPRLQHSLASAQADQPKLVHDLLEALAEHLARGCDPRDIVICPRAEWKPEPYLAQVAEPAAPYPAPSSPVDEVVAAEDARRAAAPAAGAASTVVTKASIRAQAKAAAPGSGQS